MMVVHYSVENLYKNEEVNVSEIAEKDEETEKELLEIFYYERYPTLIYFTPLALKCIQRKVNENLKKRYTSIGQKYNMSFKMIKSDSKLVKTVLFSYGFLQCSSKNPNCNLFWSNTHLGPHVLRSLRPWQRVNHFPRSFMITKKDILYVSIDRAMIQYGSCYDFIPDFFVTPLSDSKRLKLIEMCRKIEKEHLPPFIVKPACSSCGRHITFLKSAADVEKLNNMSKLLISRYIDRPLLINNLKSDLRVYVLVTSFYPLIVYIYSDGLARFAVHEYNEENRKNYLDVNAHLTNYSLNKYSSRFIKNQDCTTENVGHKWTLGAFLREFERLGHDSKMLMVRIEDIVIKTLLSIQGSVAASCRKFNLHPKCCFEVFGFDILVDEDLKPWLLETNLSPSLACDAPLDSVLKTHLLCDILNIASVPLVLERNINNRCAFDDLDDQKETNDQLISSNNNNNSFDVTNSEVSNGNAVNLETDLEIKPRSSSVTGDYSKDKKNELFHSDTCSALSTSSGTSSAANRKRKILNIRASKVRKAQLSYKPIFSANSITPQYLARAKCHFDKLELEFQRKGRFIRVFPRSTTWELYNLILEDVGQEKWDRDLHSRMNEGVTRPEITVRDVEKAHEQLLNPKKYPRQEDLDPIVRDVLLKQAFIESEKYKMKMYSSDIKPYPSSLPFVRMEARRRTKSLIIAEEARRNYLKAKNNKNAALTHSTIKNEPTTTDMTVSLNNNLTNDSSVTLIEKMNLEKTEKLIIDSNINYDSELKQQSNNGTKAFPEVFPNFILKNGKDNLIVLKNSTVEKIETQ